MDSSLLRQFGYLMRRNRARFNQRLVIFGFFFIISSVIWYLSKLSHEYTTSISYPVKYVNLPKGKVLIGEPPEKLSLRVKGFGYTLLNYKMSAILVPLEIDVTKSKFKSIKGQPSKLYIPTTLIESSFTSQLSSDLVLEDIYPDTLFLEFGKMIEKRVKVKPVYNLTYEKQYMLSGDIMANPDSILISGPQSVVDTIHFIQTRPIFFDRLNETKEITIKLQLIQQVNFQQRRVKITIPVEKFTESTLKIPVEIINVPNGYKITIIPLAIDVRMNVAFSHFFELKPQLFKVVGELNSKNPSDNKIKLNLISSPNFVNVIDYEPKYVEYILESE